MEGRSATIILGVLLVFAGVMAIRQESARSADDQRPTRTASEELVYRAETVHVWSATATSQSRRFGVENYGFVVVRCSSPKSNEASIRKALISPYRQINVGDEFTIDHVSYDAGSTESSGVWLVR